MGPIWPTTHSLETFIKNVGTIMTKIPLFFDSVALRASGQATGLIFGPKIFFFLRYI